VLAAAVVSTERPEAQTVRMRLRPGSEQISPLVALAQREVACCPFFRFALDIDADGLAFTVTVPPDAESILDAFATLAPQ